MNYRPILLAASALLATACASSIRYDDPGKVETVNIDFGSTDLQTLAGSMADSLTTAPQLSYYEKTGDDKRIVVYTAGIDNRTSEHIDTSGIMDSIRVSLVKGGKFRVAADQAGQEELGEQVRFQQESGRVDAEQAKSFGKQLGADMVLTGRLRSIEKSRPRSVEDAGGKTDDVYYQFVMELTDITTGEIIWAEQKELRKTKKTSLFGK